MPKRPPKRKYPSIPGVTGAAAAPAENDLRAEIQALRDVLRRLVDEAQNEMELKDLIRATDVIGRASARLAELLKAQEALQNDDCGSSVLAQVLEKANELIAEEANGRK